MSLADRLFRLELVDVPADDLADSLLQVQMFPNIKASDPELPPFFGSATFTRNAAIALSSDLYKSCHTSRYVGLRMRRFDGLVRRLGVPHPVAYSRLVMHLHTHWHHIEPHLRSHASMIRPRPPDSKGRLIAMDYGASHEKAVRESRAAQGRRYVVRADISNCFPSIYSHSIEWALRGKDAAKASARSGTRSWEGDLDALARNCHDGETRGLMIGPAFSNILAELVLQRIDADLMHAGHEFVRYIDDYTSYTDSYESAELFVVDLDRALTRYGLVLNTRKTHIRSLREVGLGEGWINDIGAHLPRSKGAQAALRYLQQCESIALSQPSDSVLTYGVKALLNRRKCPAITDPLKEVRDGKAELTILDELLRLAYFHPHLMNLFARQLRNCARLLDRTEKNRIADLLRRSMRESAARRETDVVLWHVYSLRIILRRPIHKQDIVRLLNMEDDLVTLALSQTTAVGLRHAVNRVRGIEKDDRGDCQEHWLVRYEFYRTGHLRRSDLSKRHELPWFDEARRHGMQFSGLA